MKRRALLLLLPLAVLLWLQAATRPGAPPGYEATRAAWRPSDAQLLDRHGALLHSLRLDYMARRGNWVALRDISPALIDAVLQAEDRRFREHGGVDVLAVAGALRDRFAGGIKRGASTLEMQLAAQLDAQLAAGAARRGLLDKLRQMRSARALAQRWTKDQTLEAYLNVVSYRGELQGIAAAAAALLGKPASALTQPEARVLAALLRAPQAAPETVARRACALSPQGDCAAERRLALALPSASAATSDAGLAPHLARRLLRMPGERRISTLDARLQALARQALDAQLRQLDGERVRDAAAVIVDNASGEVLAYVGSAGRSSRAPQVDGARALRQAGSTLKPFLYSLAIEHGWLTAASLLDDAPLALEAGSGLYRPQNYDQDYRGLVSLRHALAGSLNIPAVRTLLISGIGTFRERLHALGYTGGLTESGEYYGYSLALGSVEVSLLEQVNAYRTLANGGRHAPLRFAADEPAATPRAIISPQAAWIVSDILADRAARAISFDLDGPLSTPYWSAVKTGTSKNLRDNWCIGYSARHTVGVWVGNFEGDAMRTVSGITGAGPAWREIMDALHQKDDAAPPPPPGLLRQRVHYADGAQTAREEWFVAGTQTATVAAAAPTPARARLVSPAAGSFIALDPDIPLDHQHIALRAEPASSALRLRLDGRDLGDAGSAHLWTPLPGEHRLALLDAQARELDAVTFTVRAPR